MTREDDTDTSRSTNESCTTMNTHRHGSRVSIRAAIGITLIAVWTVATLTGILLYVTPEGRKAGQNEVLLGLAKTTWGDIHWWVSLAAVGVTIVHVVVDWRTFRACVRHITHTSGPHAVVEQ